jgi:two-component system, response regulator RegA
MEEHPETIPQALGPWRPEPGAIDLSWLVRLRWGAIAGQLGMVAIAVVGLGVDLAVAPLVAIVAVEAATDWMLAARVRRAGPVGERRRLDAVAGDVLRVEIRDDGEGMSPDVCARAFDPFFTVKPTGRGMGLGLFLARDVLERIGGRVELRSRGGAGTSAEVSLPVAAGLPAGDADEAVSVARRQRPARAVIDLRMPGRSGIDLVRELLELDDAMQIVVLTGYGSIATAIDAIRLGAVYYLHKPADADEILAALARGMAPAGDGAASELATPSLARAEWEHISRVLADCGGNVSEAARRLGLHRRSLQRKLQKVPPRS